MTARQYARAQAIVNDERTDPNERDNARRMCAEYEAIHGKPKVAYGLRPWWTLKIALRDSPCWLGNDREFRRAVRALRDGRKQREYMFEWATVKAVQDGAVDWAWFPESEPWRPPREMQVYDPRSVFRRDIGSDEQIVQWPDPVVHMGTVRKRGGLRDGELPGRRSSGRARGARKG